jgi:hypothetical protein
MRRGISKGLLAGVLWMMADAAPVWPQSANTAALVNSFIGVGESATSTLSSLATQHQALELQREQAQQTQQERANQQDQADAQQHHCPAGESGAVLVHADGSRELICEQRR